jgi:chitinase
MKETSTGLKIDAADSSEMLVPTKLHVITQKTQSMDCHDHFVLTAGPKHPYVSGNHESLFPYISYKLSLFCFSSS